VIQIKGGNGSTKEKAIRIVGADTELKGIDAEFNYIERKVGYFEIESQAFLDEGTKKYDRMKVVGITGKKKELWFDITDYYGEYDE
jgi:hypothetical protein